MAGIARVPIRGYVVAGLRFPLTEMLPPSGYLAASLENMSGVERGQKWSWTARQCPSLFSSEPAAPSIAVPPSAAGTRILAGSLFSIDRGQRLRKRCGEISATKLRPVANRRRIDICPSFCLAPKKNRLRTAREFLASADSHRESARDRKPSSHCRSHADRHDPR